MTIEEHPLKPFLPQGARVLFLGSFPPPRKRWSMEFFYPNWLNDFWRIMGLIFLGEKTALEEKADKRFDQERIVRLTTEHGLAFYDTARKVCRTKDNASDQFLEIQEPTDVGHLLSLIPSCTQVVTTGGKASEELFKQTDAKEIPAVGTCTTCRIGNREIRWWRMPSTSRAYPMKLERKAEYYRLIFRPETYL
ncbi:MAG: uracil-DNA glycosylase family protein [Bacteroidaceae bacterium]